MMQGHEIIGTAPTGERVLFNSLSEAGRELGVNKSSLSRVLKGQLNHTHGWRFEYYMGQDPATFAELTPTLRATAVPGTRQGGVKYTPPRPKPEGWDEYVARRDAEKTQKRQEAEARKAARKAKASKSHRVADEDLTPYGLAHREIDRALAEGKHLADLPINYDRATRYQKFVFSQVEYADAEKERMTQEHAASILAGPHSWGYYMGDMNNAVCPVCGAVLANSAGAAWEHIKAHLAGRDYIFLPGGRIIVRTQSNA